MSTTLTAFENTTMTKPELLKELRIHQKQDDFIQGTYEENKKGQFKGCAVGCSLESLSRKKGLTIRLDDHQNYEPHFGIPKWLARVEDRIFEGLPTEDAKKWPVQFTSAINVGADLNTILRPYLVVVLKATLPCFDHDKYPAIFAGIELIIKLLKNKKSTKEQFAKARTEILSARSDAAADAAAYAAADAAAYAAYAAYAAAAYAAYAAADAAAYAAYAAYADADAAAYAAAADADADADAADAYAAAAAARYKFYKFLAVEIVKLIKNCK